MNMTLLGNRYRILRSLATGGFGETFLAEDTHTPSNRQCAIKQLKPIMGDPAKYQLMQERFQREAEILETLGEGHSQIPRLYAYFEENGKFYLVQEYIEGLTLTQTLEAKGLQSDAAVRELLLKILPILEYVHHHRIIHRDIKPNNIIIRQKDGLPVLIDFGVVKELFAPTGLSPDHSTPSIVVGTPGFMPPEQAAGRPVFASDLYSLGLTAIYLLTGKFPHQLENDPQTGEVLWQMHAPHTTHGLAIILNKAIRSHPQQRYATAPEMLAALEAATDANLSAQTTIALSPAQLSAPPPATAPMPAPTRSSKPAMIAGIVGTVAALTIAVIYAGRSPEPVSNQQVSEPSTSSIPSESPSSRPLPDPENVNPSPTSSPPISVSEVPVVPTQEPSAIPTPTQNQPPVVSPPPTPTTSPTQTPASTPQPPETVATASGAGVKGLPPGTNETDIRRTFGEPAQVSEGYYPDTDAMLYNLEPNRIDLGFIVDSNSRQLLQSEVSFAQSVPLPEMQTTLEGMAGGNLPPNVKQELENIQQRRSNYYDFILNNGWKGTIERNSEDRIYIAIWEPELH